MKLTAENVVKIFRSCLFEDGAEPTSEEYTVVESVQGGNIGLCNKKLDNYRDDIFDMLKQLSTDFMETGGGGTTFFNACNDKDGNQWTDMHQTMDELFMLGQATKRAKFLMPREMWGSFPGGMLYVAVLDKPLVSEPKEANHERQRL